MRPARWRDARARQGLAQSLVLDRERVAEPGSRQGRVVGKKRQHLPLQAASLLVTALGDDLQMGRLRVGRDQFEVDRRGSRRGTVLAGAVAGPQRMLKGADPGEPPRGNSVDTRPRRNGVFNGTFAPPWTT
jgi:hypothetical protein